jgi:hypothetical protein
MKHAVKYIHFVVNRQVSTKCASGLRGPVR